MVGLPSYVRMCRGCGISDTHSLFGRPEMIDATDSWACRFCPSTAWCLERLAPGVEEGPG